MDTILLFGISLVLFSILYLLNAIVDYFCRLSGTPNILISIDNESVSIVSEETFYSSLSHFLFESKRSQVCHFRKDLDLRQNVTCFEKYCRTNDSNVIRNYTIWCDLSSNYTVIIKSSSYIIILNIDIKQQDFLCNREIEKLQDNNFKVISRQLILDNRVIELRGIDKRFNYN